MNIIERPATQNRCYQISGSLKPHGIVLHSIGTPQPSAEVMAKAYNVYRPNGKSVCVHAFLDNEAVYKIMPWDRETWHVGGAANNTHIGIEMCEPRQIKYISPTEFTCSDYPAAREYAKAAYANAVEIFAKLCKEYKLDPLKDGVIISHSEAYKRGIGSNHGDPEHLWKGLGLPYTMDTFRKDVAEKMEEETMTRYKTVDEMPNAYKGTIQRLIDEKIIAGRADGTLDLSEDMVRCVIYLDRMMAKAEFPEISIDIDAIADEVSGKIAEKIIEAFKKA